MDKTTTIFFTLDKNVNRSETVNAAIAVARTCRAPLYFVETDESGTLGDAGNDAMIEEIKQKQLITVQKVKESGNLWSAMKKLCDKNSFAIVGAKVTPLGLMGMGGGMSSKVSDFNCPILYLNERSKWMTPRVIVMPMDENSETRQKLIPVAKWAKLLGSKVVVFGVRGSDAKEDKQRNEIYAVQGHNYMVEKEVAVELLDSVYSKNIAETVIEVAHRFENDWVAILSNREKAFGASAYQLVCEKADNPLLIIPYVEAGVAGGTGY